MCLPPLPGTASEHNYAATASKRFTTVSVVNIKAAMKGDGHVRCYRQTKRSADNLQIPIVSIRSVSLYAYPAKNTV